MKRIVKYFLDTRTKEVVNRVWPYLKKSKRIMDIGSGTGLVAKLLGEKGLDVIAVDVADFHGPRFVQPIIYDGEKLPFKDKSFDTALLLMVMHHTPQPQVVFQEAKRVAKEVIVIETSYVNIVHKIFTVLTDALGNLQFKYFWKSYKSDGEWQKLFGDNGFTIEDVKYYWDVQWLVPYLHIAYYLK